MEELKVVENDDGIFIIVGPDRDGTLDVLLESSPCILMQGQIRGMLDQLDGCTEPCLAFNFQPVFDEERLMHFDVAVCTTVSGDAIIFNARPGRSLEERCVLGAGVEAMVVPSTGRYTTYKEAARVAPLELRIDFTIDQLPKKRQRQIVKDRLLRELEEIADAGPARRQKATP